MDVAEFCRPMVAAQRQDPARGEAVIVEKSVTKARPMGMTLSRFRLWQLESLIRQRRIDIHSTEIIINLHLLKDKRREKEKKKIKMRMRMRKRKRIKQKASCDVFLLE